MGKKDNDNTLEESIGTAEVVMEEGVESGV